MKTKLSILFAILISFSFAKAVEVPDAVLKSFKAKFSEVKKTKWEKEKDGNYEAEFDLNGKEMSATFLPDGTWKETETEIDVSELPKAVAESLNKLYPGTKIREAAKILRSDNTQVYEAEIKINGKKTDVLFDEKGNKI